MKKRKFVWLWTAQDMGDDTVSNAFNSYSKALTDMMLHIEDTYQNANAEPCFDPLIPPHRNDIRKREFHSEELQAAWVLHKRELRA